MKPGATACAALVACAGLSFAQTANELRDPRSSVFGAFPEADSFRAIVRDVDQPARVEVERRLPFRVHFNELGPHALYVAFRERKPLGVMYVRRDEGQWGFTEIGWAMTLDLRLLGFRVLRGRSQVGGALERSGFARRLAGLGFEQLVDLHRDGLEGLVEDGLVPEGAEHLADTVLRSGLKTLLVTEAVWRGELSKLRDLEMGLDAFPAAERFRRQSFDFGAAPDGARHVASVQLMHAVGAARSELGTVARTEVRDGDHQVTLRWVLTPERRVLRVVAAGPSVDAPLRASCSRAEGRLLADGADDQLVVAFVARELSALLPASPSLGRR